MLRRTESGRERRAAKKSEGGGSRRCHPQPPYNACTSKNAQGARSLVRDGTLFWYRGSFPRRCRCCAYVCAYGCAYYAVRMRTHFCCVSICLSVRVYCVHVGTFQYVRLSVSVSLSRSLAFSLRSASIARALALSLCCSLLFSLML